MIVAKRIPCSTCGETGFRANPPYDRECAHSPCKNCDGDGSWYAVPAASILPIHIEHPDITMSHEELKELMAVREVHIQS